MGVTGVEVRRSGLSAPMTGGYRAVTVNASALPAAVRRPYDGGV